MGGLDFLFQSLSHHPLPTQGTANLYLAWFTPLSLLSLWNWGILCLSTTCQGLWTLLYLIPALPNCPFTNPWRKTNAWWSLEANELGLSTLLRGAVRLGSQHSVQTKLSLSTSQHVRKLTLSAQGIQRQLNTKSARDGTSKQTGPRFANSQQR